VVAAIIIAAVVILTIGWQVKYLIERKASPLAGAALLLLAGAIPALVGMKTLAPEVLDPGAGDYRGKVSQQITHAQMDIPAGYALLVTATLAELEEDEKDPEKLKTAYNLKVKGDRWEQSASGVMKRKNAGAGDAVDAAGGPGVREQGKRRSGRLGEDLQDRYEFRGSGPASVDVTNWSGGAAETLDLEVVEAPPPKSLLWGAVVVLSIIGLFFEVRMGADQLAGNVAFLALWAVFLRDGVTPLDGWQEISKAVLPSAILGWGAVGGLAYLGVKFGTPKPAPDAPDESAAAPVVEEPGPESEEKGRRGRRRKRKGGGNS
jgi:hypothetical protein